MCYKAQKNTAVVSFPSPEGSFKRCASEPISILIKQKSVRASLNSLREQKSARISLNSLRQQKYARDSLNSLRK
jgi:hypothetical protein